MNAVLGVVLLTGVGCASVGARARPMLISGVLRNGTPGAPDAVLGGYTIAAARERDRFCERPMATTVTDTAGRFTLTLPSDAVGAAWTVCVSESSGRPARFPMFSAAAGQRVSSLKCLFHGESGSPECALESLEQPPNDR